MQTKFEIKAHSRKVGDTLIDSVTRLPFVVQGLGKAWVPRKPKGVADTDIPCSPPLTQYAYCDELPALHTFDPNAVVFIFSCSYDDRRLASNAGFKWCGASKSWIGGLHQARQALRTDPALYLTPAAKARLDAAGPDPAAPSAHVDSEIDWLYEAVEPAKK